MAVYGHSSGLAFVRRGASDHIGAFVGSIGRDGSQQRRVVPDLPSPIEPSPFEPSPFERAGLRWRVINAHGLAAAVVIVSEGSARVCVCRADNPRLEASSLKHAQDNANPVSVTTAHGRECFDVLPCSCRM